MINGKSVEQQIYNILDCLDAYEYQLSSSKEYVAQKILGLTAGAWVSVDDGRPLKGKPFIAWTVNGKAMAVSGRKLDGWFIDKYRVTHWLILNPPK